MEENTTNESDKIESKEKTASPKDKKNKNEKKGQSFFAKHKAEFKKIKWPSRQELFKETVVVIIVSLAVGVIIYGIDTVLQFGFGKLIDIL